MQTPIVHLNGTSLQGLAEQYETAYRAVHAAIEAVSQSAPHGRDYYVSSDPAAYTTARGEHSARLTRLQTVADELLALHQAVKDQRRG